MIKNIKNIGSTKNSTDTVIDDPLEFTSIMYSYCIHIIEYIIVSLNISFMCLLIEMICIIQCWGKLMEINIVYIMYLQIDYTINTIIPLWSYIRSTPIEITMWFVIRWKSYRDPD